MTTAEPTYSIPNIAYSSIAAESLFPGLNLLDVSDSDLAKSVADNFSRHLGTYLGLDTTSHPASSQYLELALRAVTNANLTLAPAEKIKPIHVEDFFEDTAFREVVVGICGDEAVQDCFGPGGSWSRLTPNEQQAISAPIVQKLRDAKRVLLVEVLRYRLARASRLAYSGQYEEA